MSQATTRTRHRSNPAERQRRGTRGGDDERGKANPTSGSALKGAPSLDEAEAPCLLSIEHRGVRATQPVRVLITVFLAASILGPQSLRFGSRDAAAALGPIAAVDLIALIHVALIVSAAVAGLAGVMARPVRCYWRTLLARSLLSRLCIRWFILWLAFSGLSVLWSVAPTYTIISWLRLFGIAALTGVFVAVGRDRLSLVRFFWWFSAAKMASIAVLALIDPSLVGREIEVGYRLTGGVLPDYGVSGLIFVAASIALYRVPVSTASFLNPMFDRRWFVIVSVLAGTGFTLLARTRFSILALLALLAVVAWTSRTKLLALLATGGVIGLALVDSPRINEAAFTVVFRGREGLFELSARDLALEHVLAWSAENRLLGAGFAAGSRTAMVDFMRETGIQMGAPHDALSAVVPDTGLVGLALLVPLTGLLFVGLLRSLSSRKVDAVQPFGVFVAGMVMLAFSSSIASAGIASADMVASVPLIVVAALGGGRSQDDGVDGSGQAKPAIDSSTPATHLG